MQPFGKRPIRSLNSFGVSGLLGEECRVFYNSLFNTRNLGRVTDLLAARLNKAGPDELRFRTLIVTSVFEAYRAQIDHVMTRKRAANAEAARKAEAAGQTVAPKDEEERLDEPMTIECGIDSEKIAIGMSFTLPPGTSLDANGLGDRLAKRQPRNSFEQLLLQVYEAGDRFVIRTQPTASRVEIVALLGLPGQIDAQEIARRVPAEVVILPATLEASSKATAYEELGDTDYEKLLADDTRLKGGKGKSLGESLVKKMNELGDGDSRITAGRGEGEEDTSLEGKDLTIDDSEQTVGGREKKDKSQVSFAADGGDFRNRKVKGRSRAGGDSEVEVGGDAEDADGSLKKVKGINRKTDGTEAEIESDSIEDGETRITFKGGSEEAEVDEQLRIAAGGAKKARRRLFGLRPPKAEEAEEEKVAEEEIVIQGEKKKREKEQKITFKGEDYEEDEEDPQDPLVIRRKLRLKSAKKKGPGFKFVDEVVDDEQNAASAPVKQIRRLVRRIWPFRKKPEATEGEGPDSLEGGDEDQVFNSSADEAFSDEKIVVKGKREKKKEEDGDGHEYRFKEGPNGEIEEIPDAPKSKTAEAASESAPDETQTILKNLEEKVLDKTVDKVQREAMKLKDEIKDERTKRWVDNLTRDLISEKSNLRETAKRISQSVRQKEQEFKNKQSVLEEELRKKDEAMAQKVSALNRTREQLAQVTRSLDRLKQLGQEAADAASFKQKYTLAQKVLQSTKDENTVLQSKIDDLRMQVNTLQMGSKSRGPSNAEHAVLQSKYDRVYKQVEDMKRQNQILTAQMTDRRSAAATTQADELKKKLEGSNRLYAVSKKENELLQGRLGKMQKDEKGLKAEILRLQDALKNAQTIASVGRARAAAMASPSARPKPPGSSGNSGSGTGSGTGTGTAA